MRESDSLDVLVDAITSQVAARLNLQLPSASVGRFAARAPGGDAGFDPAAPCDATDATCTGCGFCTTRKEGVVDMLISIGAARVASATR